MCNSFLIKDRKLSEHGRTVIKIFTFTFPNQLSPDNTFYEQVKLILVSKQLPLSDLLNHYALFL